MHLSNFVRVICKRIIYFCVLIFFGAAKLVGLDELIGKSVIGALGNHIGDVFGLDIDPSTWKITHLQVKLSGIAAKEIGVKKVFKTPTVRVPTPCIDKIGVVITLNQSVFDIKEHQDFSVISSSKTKLSPKNK
jgi:sporulation protein YlmC with PRC-barrel domain